MSVCLFLDIDGSLIHQVKPRDYNSPTLDGTKELVDEVYKNSGQIIITTSRPYSEKKKTEIQLEKHGIKYDQIIMDLNDCPRIVINDRGKGGMCRAFACDLEWNKGVKGLWNKIKSWLDH